MRWNGEPLYPNPCFHRQRVIVIVCKLNNQHLRRQNAWYKPVARKHCPCPTTYATLLITPQPPTRHFATPASNNKPLAVDHISQGLVVTFSPVQSARKFSAVFGAVSILSSKVMRPMTDPATSTSKKTRGFLSDGQGGSRSGICGQGLCDKECAVMRSHGQECSAA